jgi:ABC-type transport system substrate-binding protein
LGQAVASALSQIGITLKIDTNNGTFAQLLGSILSRQYPVVVFSQRPSDIYTLIQQGLLPGGPANAFKLTDPTLNQLIAAASAAPTLAGQDAGMQKVTARLDQLAWVVPIAITNVAQFTRPTVKNVPSTYKTVDPDPVSPVTGDNWYSSGS